MSDTSDDLVYTTVTACLSIDIMIPRIYLVKIIGISMDIQCISTPLDLHGISESMDIQCIFHWQSL
jgi:hypothetical protein